jgi:hypothetical protein
VAGTVVVTNAVVVAGAVVVAVLGVQVRAGGLAAWGRTGKVAAYDLRQFPEAQICCSTKPQPDEAAATSVAIT